MGEISVLSAGIENAIRGLEAVRREKLTLPAAPVCVFHGDTEGMLDRIAAAFLECRAVLDALFSDTERFLAGAEQAFRTADDASADAIRQADSTDAIQQDASADAIRQADPAATIRQADSTDAIQTDDAAAAYETSGRSTI